MGKLLSLIMKIFFIVLAIFLIYCATIGREFGIKQVNTIMGMYYVHVGDEAYRNNNMQEAVDAYQNGLNLFPEHYEAWLNLGNIYVAYEDYYSAAQAYQNAILAKENYTLARMNLGIISAEKLGDFDSAIAEYQSIVDSKHFLLSIPFVFDNKKSETDNKAIAYYNMGRAYSQKAFYLPQNKKKEKKELLGQAAVAYEKAHEITKTDYDSNYNDFVKAMLQDDLDAMNEYMNRVALKTFSYFDTGNRPSGAEPERFYHGFVLGMIVDLQSRYVITSNGESGFGRYDIMLEPRNPQEDDAIILEFKVFNRRRENSLEDTVNSALDQIEKMRYAEKLVERGIPKERIRRYGFAFRGKEVLIG